jgi:hypothetical protein
VASGCRTRLQRANQSFGTGPPAAPYAGMEVMVEMCDLLDLLTP